MRKLIEQVEGEGLDALIGERITLFCANYIYTGKLVGVNDTCILLHDAAVVYETGPFSDGAWKDAQKLPNDLYVTKSSIESYTVLK